MEYWALQTDGIGLEKDEVCLLTQHHVALYDRHEKTQWRKGKLSLTTHHLLYLDDADSLMPLLLPLELIGRSGQTPRASSGFGPFSSDKIIIPLPKDSFVKLSFRDGGQDRFFTALKKTLEKKTWLMNAAPSTKTPAPSLQDGTKKRGPDPPGAAVSSPPNPANGRGVDPAIATGATPTPSSPSVPRGVGIAGVQQASAQSVTMTETLKDVDDVMKKASALVSSIRLLHERNEAASAAGAATGSETTMEKMKLESIESTLGMGLIVTRDSGNSVSDHRFYKDLAVELHTWMTHERNATLFNRMPVVPLIELFALYNRARGGDLVSPLDVLNACTYMTSKLPLSNYDLVTFASGRKALAHRDESLLLAKLVPLLGPQLINTKGSPIQVEWQKRALQRSGGGGAAGPLLQIPSSDTLPRSAAELKFISDVQLAESMQMSTEVAADVLDSLTRKGFLCSVGMGFDCFVYTWNIFVF